MSEELEIELQAVEAAMEKAMARREWNELNTRRAEILGQMKQENNGGHRN